MKSFKKQKTGTPVFISFPENGAQDVSTKIIPRITFNEPVRRESLNNRNLFLFDGNGVLVEISTEVVADSSVCLKPKAPLSHGQKYIIRFGFSLQKTNGNILDLENSAIEFTTI